MGFIVSKGTTCLSSEKTLFYCFSVRDKILSERYTFVPSLVGRYLHKLVKVKLNQISYHTEEEVRES